MKKRVTWFELIEMFRGRPTELLWARRDTRWDPYPQREPVQLVAHNWEGFWCPQPDGTWYKSPVSYVGHDVASTPDLRGAWVETSPGLMAYHRSDS